MSAELQDKSILVTRPQHQAEEFIQQLQQLGARVLGFPTIEIKPIKLNDQLSQTLGSINNYDLLIFISVNAVSNAQQLLLQSGISADSLQMDIAVIGGATLEAARRAGFTVNLVSAEGFNSEALLKHPKLQSRQIKNSKILIIRGAGGLETLADALTARGAIVSYAQVYRRCVPSQDGEIKRQKLSEHWLSLSIDIITVTSNETLQNLYDMLEDPGREAMLNTPLIVPSRRCYELAESLGFSSVTMAGSAINQHMIEAILAS